MIINKFTIHIKLLDENVDVWRPTEGVLIRDTIFEILPTENYDPEDEHWEFFPGNTVRCVRELHKGREILVAIEKISD